MAPLFAHHNRNITAENNIFAFNRISQIDRGGQGGFELTCRRNIFYYNEGKAVGEYGSEHCARDVCAFDHNLYWNAAGKPVMFGNKTLAEWQSLGQDQNSRIADPLFVDPDRGNPANPSRARSSPCGSRLNDRDQICGNGDNALACKSSARQQAPPLGCAPFLSPRDDQHVQVAHQSLLEVSVGMINDIRK